MGRNNNEKGLSAQVFYLVVCGGVPGCSGFVSRVPSPAFPWVPVALFVLRPGATRSSAAMAFRGLLLLLILVLHVTPGSSGPGRSFDDISYYLRAPLPELGCSAVALDRKCALRLEGFASPAPGLFEEPASDMIGQNDLHASAPVRPWYTRSCVAWLAASTCNYSAVLCRAVPKPCVAIGCFEAGPCGTCGCRFRVMQLIAHSTAAFDTEQSCLRVVCIPEVLRRRAWCFACYTSVLLCCTGPATRSDEHICRGTILHVHLAVDAGHLTQPLHLTGNEHGSSLSSSSVNQGVWGLRSRDLPCSKLARILETSMHPSKPAKPVAHLRSSLWLEGHASPGRCTLLIPLSSEKPPNHHRQDLATAQYALISKALGARATSGAFASCVTTLAGSLGHREQLTWPEGLASPGSLSAVFSCGMCLHQCAGHNVHLQSLSGTRLGPRHKLLSYFRCPNLRSIHKLEVFASLDGTRQILYEHMPARAEQHRLALPGHQISELSLIWLEGFASPASMLVPTSEVMQVHRCWLFAVARHIDTRPQHICSRFQGLRIPRHTMCWDFQPVLCWYQRCMRGRGILSNVPGFSVSPNTPTTSGFRSAACFAAMGKKSTATRIRQGTRLGKAQRAQLAQRAQAAPANQNDQHGAEGVGNTGQMEAQQDIVPQSLPLEECGHIDHDTPLDDDTVQQHDAASSVGPSPAKICTPLRAASFACTAQTAPQPQAQHP